MIYDASLRIAPIIFTKMMRAHPHNMISVTRCTRARAICLRRHVSDKWEEKSSSSRRKILVQAPAKRCGSIFMPISPRLSSSSGLRDRLIHKLESIHSAPRARFAASNRDCQITSFGNSSYPRNHKSNLATAKPYALVAAVPSSGSSCFRSSRISLSRCACRGISVLRSFVDDSIQLSRARYFGFLAIRAKDVTATTCPCNVGVYITKRIRHWTDVTTAHHHPELAVCPGITKVAQNWQQGRTADGKQNWDFARSNKTAGRSSDLDMKTGLWAIQGLRMKQIFQTYHVLTLWR